MCILYVYRWLKALSYEIYIISHCNNICWLVCFKCSRSKIYVNTIAREVLVAPNCKPCRIPYPLPMESNYRQCMYLNLKSNRGFVNLNRTPAKYIAENWKTLFHRRLNGTAKLRPNVTVQMKRSSNWFDTECTPLLKGRLAFKEVGNWWLK